ncbi:response regulator transcription factor [Gracilibacillus alcaliphilus]|uniref:response regulator transcription factor n=1 Tax=Gracilibacillus alcaliphilus TaxID=1401441 RepID=UPI00195F0BC3|nr:response regulator [Gracilibacillus alcaliphilus]MBM7678127.1 two-component system response regulator YesN [Gracilibacillus alcaliphilus]
MYNLLIVDDEPIIADSIQLLFDSLEEPKLNIFTSYNAYEALELMNENDIDIVLSDIRMPGMDGIELQKEIYKHWKNCKMIFLTGFNDFNYIQTIIRNGGSIDYILKNEDDEEIIHAVRKAVAKIEDERQQEQLLLKSQAKIKTALPVMQKEYLVELIHNQDLAAEQEKLSELEISLDPDQDLIMVLGRIGFTKNNQPAVEKYLAVLQQLFTDGADQLMQLATISYDKRRIMLLIQPLLSHSWSKVAETTASKVEVAQNQMKKQYSIPISFSYTVHPFPWQLIGESFYRLNMMIARERGSKKEVMVQDRDQANVDVCRQLNVNDLLQLEGYLELGEKQSFHQLFFSLYRQAEKDGNRSLYELLTALTNIILQYLSKHNLYSSLQIDVDEVMDHTHPVNRSFDQAFHYLVDLSEVIFSNREKMYEDSYIQMIVQLQNYIRHHLNEDLSLTKLAELVHHSPTYLSKLYKRKTGQLLSSYIAEQRMALGKELLITTNHKIHEIATLIGYAPPYFIRHFKKMYGVTPQQFREKI